jgi:hypothetical protein
VITPALNAIMCDGMGWFDDVDYKRMLLLYDQILYLIPSTTVEFQDVTGQPANLLFPVRLRESDCYCIADPSLEPDLCNGLVQAAKADASVEGLAPIVARIPTRDRLYTWRVANADPDFGSGNSIALHPRDEVLAHTLLLNKFLVAADTLGAVPITGKNYVHALIAEKYRIAAAALELAGAETLSPVHKRDLQHGPVVAGISSAVIPDAELDGRSMEQILEFKRDNRSLFERFSLLGREALAEISSLPADRSFRRELDELINTKLWKQQVEIEDDIRAAWLRPSGGKGFARSEPVKTALKALGSGIAIGAAPWIGLKALSFGTLLAAGGAVLPWAVTEILEAVESRRKVANHGLYYLVKFAAR